MAVTVLVVVTGPPCSGKSTYVQHHKRVGDIVIDFDTLAQALGSPTPHDHPPHTRAVTIATRRAAIDAAIKAHHQGARVWIVDCSIHPVRLAIYRRAGAVIKVMAHDKATLHQRANAQRPALWHKLIDEWTPPPGLVETVHHERDW